MMTPQAEVLPKTMTDSQLLDAFVHDASEEAFGEIVNRHSSMVYGVCLRVLNDPHQAEDAAQNTFLLLTEKAATLGPETILCGWLYTAALNVARKMRRSAARLRARESAVALPAVVDEPEDSGDQDEQDLALELALQELPAAQRDAIVLCCVRGMSYADAARELNCPQETLHSRLTHGRARLRRRLRRDRRGLLALFLPVFSDRLSPGTLAEWARSLRLRPFAAESFRSILTSKAVAAVSLSALVLSAVLLAAPPAIQTVIAAPAQPVTPPALPALALPAGGEEDNDGLHLDDDRIWSAGGKLKLERLPRQLKAHVVNPTGFMYMGRMLHRRQFDLADGPAALKFSLDTSQVPRMASFQIRAHVGMHPDNPDFARGLEIGFMYLSGQVSISVLNNDTRVTRVLYERNYLPYRQHTFELVVSRNEVCLLVDDTPKFKGAHGVELEKICFSFFALVPEEKAGQCLTIEKVRVGRRELTTRDDPPDPRAKDDF